jgi:pSer/pThr/pTyr-binding forkhead associated (FHA) protein
VTLPSPELFSQACGGTLRLAIERPGGPEAVHKALDRPFALVGRERWADLPLDDSEVSRRHAYLQVIEGRVFCLDLESRNGVQQDGRSLPAGWLGPGRPVRIGPFTLGTEDDPAAPSGPAASWDPLAPRPADQDPLPAVSFDVVVGGQKGVTWRMNRVLALIGQSAACKVRIRDSGVGVFHGALLRTPLGVWVVDLLGTGGTAVNKEPVRWARLAHGDELLVGDTLLVVRYDPAPGPVVAPVVGQGAEPAAPDESARIQGELESARAETAALTARVAELESSAAELAGVREARDQADAERQRWHGEVEAAQARAATACGEAEQARAELDASQAQIAELEARIAEMEQLAAEAVRASEDWARADAGERSRSRAEVDAARAEAKALRGRLEELEASAAELADARTTLVQAAAAERADAEQRLRAELEAANAEKARAAAEADGLRDERDEARGHHDRVRGELDAARAEAAAHEQRAVAADALRADLDAAREQAAGIPRLREELDAARAEADGLRAGLDSTRRELEEARAVATGEADRLRGEADVVRAEHARAGERADAEAAAARRWQGEHESAVIAAAALRDQAAELERSAAGARDQWEADRRELLGRHEAEAGGREADRRAAAEALAAARAELDRATAEAARFDRERAGARAELEAARAEAAALRVRAAEFERSTAGAEKLRAELAAARGELDEERAGRRAEVERYGREVEALRGLRDALMRRVETLTAERERPVPHGVELGPGPQVVPAEQARAEQARAEAVRAEQARAEAVRADLQRQLAETSRQLQEARARAARLEEEVTGPKQWLTFNVMPLNAPPDQGGPPIK